jgi:hypothetical protein
VSAADQYKLSIDTSDFRDSSFSISFVSSFDILSSGDLICIVNLNSSIKM